VTIKRFLAGVILAALWVAACAVVFLPGCAALEARPAATGLVVSYATMKYIEQAPPQERGARAARVIAVADLVDVAAGGEEITLQRLAQLALERIPADLAPSDRMLAVGLVNVVEQELRLRIGHGGLESDTLIRLAPLLEHVKQSATFYLPPS
jgi:hypothetical protein